MGGGRRGGGCFITAAGNQGRSQATLRPCRRRGGNRGRWREREREGEVKETL